MRRIGDEVELMVEHDFGRRLEAMVVVVVVRFVGRE